jgi:hypothetical protein
MTGRGPRSSAAIASGIRVEFDAEGLGGGGQQLPQLSAPRSSAGGSNNHRGGCPASATPWSSGSARRGPRQPARLARFSQWPRPKRVRGAADRRSVADPITSSKTNSRSLDHDLQGGETDLFVRGEATISTGGSSQPAQSHLGSDRRPRAVRPGADRGASRPLPGCRRSPSVVICGTHRNVIAHSSGMPISKPTNSTCFPRCEWLDSLNWSLATPPCESIDSLNRSLPMKLPVYQASDS